MIGLAYGLLAPVFVVASGLLYALYCDPKSTLRERAASAARSNPTKESSMSKYFPTVSTVETPLGPCEEIWATSATHIGLRGTFTINRVLYRIRLDLHLRDGVWQEGDKDDWSTRFHALMIDREWDYPGGKPRPDTSPSARTKARDALVPWLAAYATGDGAEIVRQAGIEAHAREIESKRSQIEKLRAEIEAAEHELAALEAS